MRTHRILTLALPLCAAFASCDRLPTGNADAPGDASYDTGVTIGSGNERSQADGRSGDGGGAAEDGDGAIMDGGTTSADSTGRGGVTIGSGN